MSTKKANMPVNDRPFIVGNKELAAYLCVCEEKLRTDFLNRGLKPKLVAGVKYYYKSTIDEFINKFNEIA